MTTTLKSTSVLEPGEEEGGGVNHSSKEVGSRVGIVDWMIDRRIDTNALDHLSPRGLVGFAIHAVPQP